LTHDGDPRRTAAIKIITMKKEYIIPLRNQYFFIVIPLLSRPDRTCPPFISYTK
jgi:hypothetical protein